jgi:hypothetical protein
MQRKTIYRLMDEHNLTEKLMSKTRDQATKRTLRKRRDRIADIIIRWEKKHR